MVDTDLLEEMIAVPRPTISQQMKLLLLPDIFEILLLVLTCIVTYYLDMKFKERIFSNISFIIFGMSGIAIFGNRWGYSSLEDFIRQKQRKNKREFNPKKPHIADFKLFGFIISTIFFIIGISLIRG